MKIMEFQRPICGFLGINSIKFSANIGGLHFVVIGGYSRPLATATLHMQPGHKQLWRVDSRVNNNSNNE